MLPDSRYLLFCRYPWDGMLPDSRYLILSRYPRVVEVSFFFLSFHGGGCSLFL